MGVLKNSTNLNLYMCVLNVDGVLIFVRAEFLYFQSLGLVLSTPCCCSS